MSEEQVKYVLQQVRKAKKELTHYAPNGIDWYKRSEKTCKRLVPWLVENADGLRQYVDGVMNSPYTLRNDIRQLLDLVEPPKKSKTSKQFIKLKDSINSALDFESLLLIQAGGTVVSKLIERFLISRSDGWELESNGASDYPDLFLRSENYSKLPKFRRRKNQIYGASLKGRTARPVRVPDGLEIKTCRKNFAVDCHHAHAGLHLVLLFDKTTKKFQVSDIQIAFLRRELYRITDPSSPTTTLKASFNGEHFVSMLDSICDA